VAELVREPGLLADLAQHAAVEVAAQAGETALHLVPATDRGQVEEGDLHRSSGRPRAAGHDLRGVRRCGGYRLAFATRLDASRSRTETAAGREALATFWRPGPPTRCTRRKNRSNAEAGVSRARGDILRLHLLIRSVGA